MYTWFKKKSNYTYVLVEYDSSTSLIPRNQNIINKVMVWGLGEQGQVNIVYIIGEIHKSPKL